MAQQILRISGKVKNKKKHNILQYTNNTEKKKYTKYFHFPLNGSNEAHLLY